MMKIVAAHLAAQLADLEDYLADATAARDALEAEETTEELMDEARMYDDQIADLLVDIGRLRRTLRDCR